MGQPLSKQLYAPELCKRVLVQRKMTCLTTGDNAVDEVSKCTLSDWRWLVILVTCSGPSSATRPMLSRSTCRLASFLSNVETGEKRYHHPSQNGFIFDQPLVVADEADLRRVLQCVDRRIGCSTSDGIRSLRSMVTSFQVTSLSSIQ